jgi:CBS domain-containing protein
MTTVRSIERMATDQRVILTIQAGQSVSQAARLLGDHRVGALVVLNEAGELVGIISERDIVSKVVAPCRDLQTTPVAHAMTAPVISCRPDTPVEEAHRLMGQHHVRHLPVVENGRAVGMVSSRDILLHELTTTRELARRQSKVLTDLERQHPGITQLETDHVGRVVI